MSTVNTQDLNNISVHSQEALTEVSIEEIIELIRSEEPAEVLFQDNLNAPNVIKIVCGDKFCTDIREFKPIVTTHADVQVYIRSHDKDGIITSWKEYYVHAPDIYTQFKINIEASNGC